LKQRNIFAVLAAVPALIAQPLTSTRAQFQQVSGVDLAIIKAGVRNSDGSATFTITFDNAGDTLASGVTISEVIPSGAAVDLTRSTPGWTCAGAACTLAYGNVTPNPLAGIGIFIHALTYTLAPAGAFSGIITNTVRIGGAQADAAPDNNAYSATAEIGGAPAPTYSSRWTYVFTSDARADGKLESNDIVSMTLFVTNTSSTPASAVSVHVLENGAPFFFGATTQIVPGSVATTRGTVTTSESPVIQIPALGAGENVAIRFAARLAVAPLLSQTSIDYTAWLFDSYRPENNPNGETLQLATKPVPVYHAAQADVVKSMQSPRAAGAQLEFGDRVTYTIAVTNTGGTPISNWQLRDGSWIALTGQTDGVNCIVPLPETAASTLGAVSVVTAPLGAPLDDIDLRVPVNLAAGASGTLTFGAIVTTSRVLCNGLLSGGYNAANQARLHDLSTSANDGFLKLSNKVSAPISTTRAAALGGWLFDNAPLTVTVGAPLTFTFAITNTGNFTLTNVELINLGDGCSQILTNTIQTSQGGLIVGGSTSVTITLGTLPVNASAVVTFEVSVTPGPACTQVVQRAQVRDREGALGTIETRPVRIAQAAPRRSLFLPVVGR
jgi:hypothetical protein